MNAKSTKEWIFKFDWNNPVDTPHARAFQLLGVTITWDDETWCFHLALVLIVIRFGHVSI